MPGARRRGRPRTAWMDNVKTWIGLPRGRVNQNDRGQGYTEKVRPRCGSQPSVRGRIKNRTELLTAETPNQREYRCAGRNDSGVTEPRLEPMARPEVSRISYGIQRASQTVLDVYLKHSW